jgi:hypothetical protein
MPSRDLDRPDLYRPTGHGAIVSTATTERQQELAALKAKYSVISDVGLNSTLARCVEAGRLDGVLVDRVKFERMRKGELPPASVGTLAGADFAAAHVEAERAEWDRKNVGEKFDGLG